MPVIENTALNTIDIRVGFNDMKSKIKRNISVFAKRYAEQGENKFSFVSLSSEEELLLSDYMHKAIHDVVSQLAQVLHTYEEEDAYVTFTVTNTRWDVSSVDEFKKAFAFSVVDYCISSVVSDYFGMYFPNQAQHFLRRANEIMANLIRLCYYKQPKEESASYLSSTTGTTI